MHSFKAIPHGLPAARVRTWYQYSIRGLCCIYPAAFENTHTNTSQGEVSQYAWASWAPGFIYLPHQCGSETWTSFPLALMEPIVWIHHISMCIRSCFDILMHKITSLGKGLPPLKCSQFPLTIMEQRHTHTHHCSEKGAKYGRWLGFRSVTGDSQNCREGLKWSFFPGLFKQFHYTYSFSRNHQQVIGCIPSPGGRSWHPYMLRIPFGMWDVFLKKE